MDEAQEMLKEIEAELCRMTWVDDIDLPTYKSALDHYTGRGAKWTVHLVVVGSSDDRMAIASSTSAMAIVKLPDDLARNVETLAKTWIEARSVLRPVIGKA